MTDGNATPGTPTHAPERRCMHAACPHGHPLLHAIYQTWWYEDTPAGQRTRVTLDCCSLACLGDALTAHQQDRQRRETAR